MAESRIHFVVATNKDGKPKRGEVTRWLDEIAVPHNGDDCLLFPFYCAPSGHGRLCGRNGPAMAHVYVIEKVTGEKPSPQHECCHSCGNGHLGCVNPRHLRWGTRAENVADRKVHGVFVPPPVRRGTKNNKARFTEKSVREVRRRLAVGESFGSIARDYGVTPSSVMNIKYRKTWGWLP